METEKCWRCGAIHYKNDDNCPSCGVTSDDVRTELLRSIKDKSSEKASLIATHFIEAEQHPDLTFTCAKCKNVLPNRLKKCSICGEKNSSWKKATIKFGVYPFNDIETTKICFENSYGFLEHCSICNEPISNRAETCPHCGNPTGVHVCPKCGSTNTKTISSASKATSVFLWGPFAANKVVSKFQCKDCWHKF